MKKSVYRKAALERLATVDQLDKVMKVTSPLSWIALLGVTVIIVSVLIWSVTGSLPSTVTANGLIVNATTGTNTLRASAGGTVSLRKGSGAFIGSSGEDSLYATITPSGENEDPVDCISDQQCWVTELLVENGSAVSAGAELMRVRPVPRMNQKHVVVCYVPITDIGKIDYGMPATVTLTAEDGSSCGHMEGRVINIDHYASTSKGIESVVGTDNSMAAQFTKDGSVCAVTCELLPAGDHPSVNGYWWSNEKGFEKEFKDNLMCVVKITTKSELPIFKLFNKLKDIWGGRE